MKHSLGTDTCLACERKQYKTLFGTHLSSLEEHRKAAQMASMASSMRLTKLVTSACPTMCAKHARPPVVKRPT